MDLMRMVFDNDNNSFDSEWITVTMILRGNVNRQ